MRKKVNSKCYMCERRHPACQDKCPDYLAWKANLDATNAKIKDEKKKFEDMIASAASRKSGARRMTSISRRCRALRSQTSTRRGLTGQRAAISGTTSFTRLQSATRRSNN